MEKNICRHNLTLKELKLPTISACSRTECLVCPDYVCENCHRCNTLHCKCTSCIDCNEDTSDGEICEECDEYVCTNCHEEHAEQHK